MILPVHQFFSFLSLQVSNQSIPSVHNRDAPHYVLELQLPVEGITELHTLQYPLDFGTFFSFDKDETASWDVIKS